MGEPSFSADTQSAKQIPNPHAADSQSLLRNMAREHDYNAGSLKKAVDAPASSSASSGHSSEQEDAPPHDGQYGEYAAGQYDQHMEESIMEALDFHVKDSVNKALVKALHLFAQPIFNFRVGLFGAGSGNPVPVEVNINEPGQSN
ncbi:hypothetical protein NDU88_003378 [Pleurodeles waltl]|uniref:Uncharacterized protein n=1 Tax=Pleurodeles waltl TaxID=8319 RepID=A0AAV7MQD6_PLEWA|nr:hypothetical protein NDU88_003378 [Pleurodeles waltl]